MPRVEQTDWLETFVAVIDHGSFSAAARALHRAQSRVSTHVASLERALGGTLVDRSHRPIGPTELGVAVLPHARAVLEALERGAEAVEQHTGTLRGRVVIGCHPSVSAGFLPAVLAAVHAEHPLLRIELAAAHHPGSGLRDRRRALSHRDPFPRRGSPVGRPPERAPVDRALRGDRASRASDPPARSSPP